MKRNHFLKQAGTAAAAAAILPSGLANSSPAAPREIYEFRTYTVRNKGAFSNYLKDALIPALNKHGVKRVGVFMEMGMTEPPKFYVLIPYPSAEAVFDIPQQVAADADYQKASEGLLQNALFQKGI